MSSELKSSCALAPKARAKRRRYPVLAPVDEIISAATRSALRVDVPSGQIWWVTASARLPTRFRALVPLLTLPQELVIRAGGQAARCFTCWDGRHALNIAHNYLSRPQLSDTR